MGSASLSLTLPTLLCVVAYFSVVDSTNCTVPSDCNNTNPCLNSTCNSNTCGIVAKCTPSADKCLATSCNSTSGGCIYTTKTCPPSNACLSYTCISSTGVCSAAGVVCNDNNTCTIDTCDNTLGCIFTPKVCNDGNPCTTDACNNGTCVSTTVCAAQDPVVCASIGYVFPTNATSNIQSQCLSQNGTCVKGTNFCCKFFSFCISYKVGNLTNAPSCAVCSFTTTPSQSAFTDYTQCISQNCSSCSASAPTCPLNFTTITPSVCVYLDATGTCGYSDPICRGIRFLHLLIFCEAQCSVPSDCNSTQLCSVGTQVTSGSNPICTNYGETCINIPDCMCCFG